MDKRVSLEEIDARRHGKAARIVEARQLIRKARKSYDDKLEEAAKELLEAIRTEKVDILGKSFFQKSKRLLRTKEGHTAVAT